MAESDWVDEDDGWEDEAPKAVEPARLSGVLKASRPASEVLLSRQRARPNVGKLETLGGRIAEVAPLGRSLNAYQATAGMQLLKLLGLGDSGVKFTPQGKAAMEAAGYPTNEENSIPGPLETFREMRDERKRRLVVGSKDNKWTGRLGTGIGIAGSAFALPGAAVLKGANAAARLGNAALTATGYGALQGADAGDADLTRGEVGQFAGDVIGTDGLGNARESIRDGKYGRAALDVAGAGATGGGLTGLLAGGLAEGARALFTDPLKALGIRSGKDVLQGGSDIAAPTRKPLSDEAVEEVLDSGLMGGTTAETYANIEGAAAKQGKLYADIIERLEANGVRGPEAKALAEKMMERFREEYVVAPSSKSVPQAYADEAANLETITHPAPGLEGPAHKSLGLSQAEGLKQRLQTQARFERLNNNPTEEARQEIASMVRQANEDAVTQAGLSAGAGSEVNGLAQRFVPTKQRLGRLLEARTAAERGAVKASARPSAPGITDLLVGSTTGNPATAYLTAMATKSLRSRLPSIASRSAYGASNALRSGAASPALARYLQLAQEPLADEDERTRSIVNALMSR